MSNAGSLIACRIFLGITEAASFAVLNYYVSLFWKREEIAKRAAAVYIAVTLSGAFGGLFAWALTQIDGVHGYAGWRWIFFVEGAISFCWACASFFLFPNSPETAHFLNTEEKRLAHLRIESQDKDVPFRWSHVVAAMKSPICWLSGFIQLCAGVCYHPLSIFLPTILTGLGYGSLQTQYLTIPVYLFATAMVFFFAWLADRTQRRAPIMLFFSLFTIAGYAILLAWEVPAGAKYFACFLIVGFGNVLLLLNIAWLNGNIGPRYKRATALAFNQTISNIGSIIGGQIILDRESPRYRTGQVVAISCCGLGCIGVMTLWWLLKSRNAHREKLVHEGKRDVGVGDESVHFRYQL
jgi:MFS family permease